MSYKPFKGLGSRTYTNLSGSGTIEAVGNTFVGGTLNVSGATTLSGPASGSAAGAGSYLAVNSAGLVVLDTAVPDGIARNGNPTGVYFTSSINTQIVLEPRGINDTAIIPILSTDGGTLLNVSLTSTITASISSSLAGGLDTGTVAAETGYYTYVITKADAASPALLMSTSSNDPTMPVDYTYKSLPLLFNRTDVNAELPAYDFRDGGWTYMGTITILINGISQVEPTAVTGVTFVPANGMFVATINGRNNGTTNRTLAIDKNVNQTPGDSDGEPSAQESVGLFGLKTAGDGDMLRDWSYKGISPPDAGMAELFYYDWSGALGGSASNGLDFMVIAWKTEAWGNP